MEQRTAYFYRWIMVALAVVAVVLVELRINYPFVSQRPPRFFAFAVGTIIVGLYWAERYRSSLGTGRLTITSLMVLTAMLACLFALLKVFDNFS